MTASVDNNSVDDIISGGDSEDEVFKLYSQAKELFRSGGFNLWKFLTNSRTLRKRIEQAEGLELLAPKDTPCTD